MKCTDGTQTSRLKKKLRRKSHAFIFIQVKLYAFVMERPVDELYMEMASGHIQMNKIEVLLFRCETTSMSPLTYFPILIITAFL